MRHQPSQGIAFGRSCGKHFLDQSQHPILVEVAIPQVSVLPAFHDQLSARLGSFGINACRVQAGEMVVDEIWIDDVKSLLATFDPFADEWQQNAVLLIRRMEEGANMALCTVCRIGKVDRMFYSSHLITPHGNVEL